jgi:iodotyrosine deiodinase
LTDIPHRFVPLEFRRLAAEDMRRRARELREQLAARRSVREFSAEPVPRELIEELIRTAGSAPSGANRQPWRFVAIDDPELKRQIRVAAEKEERENYEGGRFPPEWLEALAPLGTDWRKPFLEIAPWLVVCFKEEWGVLPDGRKIKNYYVNESVGIACGLLVAAIHNAGLATLTHTPNPMRFLSELLGRPENERPYILFPIGHPAAGATVPDLTRKPLADIVQWNR